MSPSFLWFYQGNLLWSSKGFVSWHMESFQLRWCDSRLVWFVKLNRLWCLIRKLTRGMMRLALTLMRKNQILWSPDVILPAEDECGRQDERAISSGADNSTCNQRRGGAPLSHLVIEWAMTTATQKSHHDRAWWHDEVILLLMILIAAARQKLRLRFLNGSFGSSWILRGLNLISG